jgi:SAM-dependent methyltransferase
LSEENRLKNEWDFGAQAWLGFVRAGKDIHRDALNNPAMFKLAGKIEGQLVLDLACGEGYNTRILARKGAKCVGIDFSRKMIDLARKEEEKESLGISYYVVDATDLKQFSDSSFDLVTCFMSLQDIKNYRAGIAEVSRVLKNHGRFIFSIPHPCFENIVLEGKELNASGSLLQRSRVPSQMGNGEACETFQNYKPSQAVDPLSKSTQRQQSAGLQTPRTEAHKTGIAQTSSFKETPFHTTINHS